jgi:predicted dehydrogenase
MTGSGTDDATGTDADAPAGVRLAVVGLGLMGRVHARNATECGARIVGGADVAAGSREEFRAEFGVPTYETHEELLEAEDVDAVVITTPNRFHEPAAVAALEAGCDVLVEKPLAHTLESAERIAEAAASAPGFCMLGFHSRFSPAAKATRAYIEAGRFGEVNHVEATYVRRRGIPNPGSWFTTTELSGGGSLIDVGVHVVDLALYVLGFPTPTEVSGVTRSNFGAREDYADPDGFAGTWGSVDRDTEFDVDDSVSAFLRFDTGQTISLEVAWATNRPPASELVVRGTNAGATFEMEGEVVELYETGNHGVDHYVTSEIDARGGPEGHLAEMEHFLEASGAGVLPTMNTIEQGLAVQRIIDAIYRSSESGRAVTVEAPPADVRSD